MGWLLYTSVIVITIGNILGFKTDVPTIVNIVGLSVAAVGYILLSQFSIMLKEKIDDFERAIKKWKN